MQSSFVTRPGFYFGVIAAFLATAVMIVLGDLWRAPVAPQMLSDRITATLPLEVFAQIMAALESSTKPIAFAGIVLGQLFVGGLIGLMAEAALRRHYSAWLILGAVAAGVFLLLGLVITPLGGLGIFARSAFVASTTAAGAFLITGAVFACALMAGLTGRVGERSADIDEGRRKFMRWAAIGVPALIAVLYVGRFFDGLAARSQPPRFIENEGELPPVITPTEEFYTVSKNAVDPRVSADNWVLTVEGEVENEIGFTYQDFLEMDAKKQVTTLECVSNPVGGPYISNAEWTGVPLRNILEEAGIRDGVVDVALFADDDYSDSIRLEKALEPEVMLVYEINGEPLPDQHGFPIRLIVPGIYGMKHVKWLRRIELVDYDFKGYWQERGWSDPAPVLTMSKIVTPFYQSRFPLGETVLIGGVAFSGDRGISKVEVSTDGAASWVNAEVEEALSSSSWVRWWYEWEPEEEMHTQLLVRANEGDGTPQIELPQDPWPEGSTGLDMVRVSIIQPEVEEDDEESA